MEVVSTEVGGVNVKGDGGDAGSEDSGSATSGGTSSLATATVVSKRRKVDAESGKWDNASAESACVVQFGRFEVNSHTATENFGAPVLTAEDGEWCLSSNVEDPGMASCCSSNRMSSTEKERSESVDQEVKSGEVDAARIQTSYKRERIPRREPVGTEFSDDYQENNAPKPPNMVWNSRRRQLPARMPSQAEIDDFFSTEEMKAAVQFKEKYNFDFEKEEPLRGRYEWKPLTAAVDAYAAAAKEKEIIKAKCPPPF